MHESGRRRMGEWRCRAMRVGWGYGSGCTGVGLYESIGVGVCELERNPSKLFK